MAGMINFVRNRGQPIYSLSAEAVPGAEEQQSQQNHPPTANAKRRLEAASARLPTGPSLFIQRRPSSERQDLHDDNANDEDSHLSPGVIRSTSVHSAFDTESENANTTSLSVVQVEDSKIKSQGQAANGAEMNWSFNGAAPHMEDDKDGFKLRASEPSSQQPDWKAKFASVFVNHPGHSAGSIFEAGASYPSTTVGDIDEDGSIEGSDAHTGTNAFQPRQPSVVPFGEDPRRKLPKLSEKKQGSFPQQAGGSRIGRQPLQEPAGDPVNSIPVRGGARSGPPKEPVPVAKGQQSTAPQSKAAVHANPVRQSTAAAKREATNHFASDSTALASDSDAGPSGANEDDPPALDYDQDILVKMPYEDLARESLDHSPNAEPFYLLDGLSNPSLVDKLEYAKILAVEEKTKFMKTLTIDEWEEAGDWLLEQYADIIKKFNAARREKRKATVEFEKRIQERHERVEQRKRKIDAALTDMKQSGAEVLHPTPSKRQK